MTPPTEAQLLAFAAHWAERNDPAVLDREAHRASGDCVCSICGLLYYQHPRCGPPDHNGELFLNVLCTGDVVKL